MRQKLIESLYVIMSKMYFVSLCLFLTFIVLLFGIYFVLLLVEKAKEDIKDMRKIQNFTYKLFFKNWN